MLWRRGTGPGAIASIAVSAPTVIATLFSQGIDSDIPIYGGFTASLIVYIVMSLFTRPAAASTSAGRPEMSVES
jgi:SSS family solute:Na+ symporter